MPRQITQIPDGSIHKRKIIGAESTSATTLRRVIERVVVEAGLTGTLNPDYITFALSASTLGTSRFGLTPDGGILVYSDGLTGAVFHAVEGSDETATGGVRIVAVSGSGALLEVYRLVGGSASSVLEIDASEIRTFAPVVPMTEELPGGNHAWVAGALEGQHFQKMAMAGADTFTLPALTEWPAYAPLRLFNGAVGGVGLSWTAIPPAAETINNAATKAIASFTGFDFWHDGTNYFAM